MAHNKRHDLQQEILTKWGRLPLDILMDFAVNDPDPEVQLDAAKAAAPYVHAKLKQVDVDDHRPTDRPAAEIEREITAILIQRGALSHEPTRYRDLIGPADGTEDSDVGELHRHAVPADRPG